MRLSIAIGRVVFLHWLGLALAMFVASDSLAESSDWPQWRGPGRDGHAASQKLLKEWPTGGPKLLWSFKEAGAGYSASSVMAGRLYNMGASKGDCFVFCLDASTGALIWKERIDRAAVDNDYLLGWGGGPRCTPTIQGDRLFALSDLGTLACLNLADGKSVWTVNLVSAFGGSVPKWGYSESPLVDGDRVLVTPGGKNFVVGLDIKNGKEVFASKSIDSPAHYVSIVRAKFHGMDVYVTASQPGLFGIDVTTGEKLFENGSTGNGVAVIPTPVVSGDLIYHTSAYGAGNALVRIQSKDQRLVLEQVYHEKSKSMENHHGGVVLLGGVIYGFSKADGGVWMAQDLDSGKVLWRQKIGRNGSGAIALADGLLYCYNDQDGTLILAEPNREGWRPRGELAIPQQTQLDRGKGAIWAHPVIADQKLYIRDQEFLYAFDLTGI